MAISPTPVSVGVIASVVAPRNTKRVNIRFQNAGPTTLFFARAPAVPSAINYEFSILPATAVFDANTAWYETNSTSQFNCVSSLAGGILSMFETTKA